MELILIDRDGAYVGSLHVKDRTVPPDAVIWLHEAYIADVPRGVRAGGIPRYRQANTIETHSLTTSETPMPAKVKVRKRR
jgi:hypothetical protein